MVRTVIGVLVALVTGNGFVDKRRFFRNFFVWSTCLDDLVGEHLNLNINLFYYVLKTVKTVATCQEGSGGGEIEVSGLKSLDTSYFYND